MDVGEHPQEAWLPVTTDVSGSWHSSSSWTSYASGSTSYGAQDSWVCTGLRNMAVKVLILPIRALSIKLGSSQRTNIFNTIGLNWTGPLLLDVGTEEDRKRYIKTF